MTVTKITDHADRALAQLLNQFRDSARLREFVSTFAADQGLQELEDLIWAVLQGLQVENAVGVQLDKLGKLVGAPRAELTDDDDYRAVIQATIAANLSDSLALTIATVASILVSVPVRYIEAGRANFILQWEVDSQSSDAKITRIIDVLTKAKQCGVSMQLIEGVSPAFRLDSATAGLDLGKLGLLLRS